jgi:hypothetical protein
MTGSASATTFFARGARGLAEVVRPGLRGADATASVLGGVLGALAMLSPDVSCGAVGARFALLPVTIMA